MKKLFWIFGLLFLLSADLFSHPPTPSEDSNPIENYKQVCGELSPSECLLKAQQALAVAQGTIYVVGKTAEFVDFMSIPIRWGFRLVTFPLRVVGVLS